MASVPGDTRSTRTTLGFWRRPQRAWSLLLALSVTGLALLLGLLEATGPVMPPSAGPIEGEPSVAGGAHQISDPVTLLGHAPEQSELVDDLLDRFSAAGLNLPPLTIAFWASRDLCGGMGGRHRGLGEIEICTPSPRMIAHEIAHAWDAYNLSNAEREAYRLLWGAPTWSSRDYEWHERAIELAANTIAFAILNDDPEPYLQIRSYLCTYEALTGLPLPTTLATPCSSADDSISSISSSW